MRSLALLRGRGDVWSAWGRLLDVVRTGKTAPELVAGKGIYERLADDPAGFNVFNQAMTELSIAQAQVVADAFDFSDAHVIVDVGGGYGALLMAILMRYGDASGVVFDRSTCRAGSERLIAQTGLSDRCRFVGGDFFKSVPVGGDIYLLKNVIHNWDDDWSMTILRACRTAMSGDSRLLLIEPIVPEQITASLADTVVVAFDLHMLLLTGRLRTHRRAASVAVAGSRVRRDAHRADIVGAQPDRGAPGGLTRHCRTRAIVKDVLKLSNGGKSAMGRVDRVPSHAATSNSLLMN